MVWAMVSLIHGFPDTQLRSEEHTSELQSRFEIVCSLMLKQPFSSLNIHYFPSRCSSDLTAYMITDMLKTVVASGTGTQANVDGIPVAGKTGSTNIPQEVKAEYGLGNGVIDSWFSGYTT